ncbi:MAG: Uma2 family endonuclease [Sandaracinaceae bacterium]|nr:Uma2 family endonuclease [Sandaracinaceae bacterium]
MTAEVWTSLPDVGGERVRRLRRDEYDRLVGAGVFADERVELIRGVIVRMAPQGPSHAGPIEVLTELLVPPLVGRARVRVQLPLIGPDESEPEPDLAVVPLGQPHREHPSAAHLVIEVARTSQVYDRGTKGPLYAEMGVPEYWVVDIAARAIEVHREPVGDRYTRVETFRDGTIPLVAYPDVTVPVAPVFG